MLTGPQASTCLLMELILQEPTSASREKLASKEVWTVTGVGFKLQNLFVLDVTLCFILGFANRQNNEQLVPKSSISVTT
jgi:hypothetical protein